MKPELTQVGSELNLDSAKIEKQFSMSLNNETTDLADGTLAQIIG